MPETNTSNSLINLGDLSKPATVLIERISAAVGAYCHPWQIRRIAGAEADAEKIRAVSQIEITDLHRRAMERFLNEEAKKQLNIENITQKALPGVGEQAKPENMSDDWIANFFDKCRLISDEEMQKLWAKVLAGEATSPGNFSKRTVNLLASLDKVDAEAFTNLCSFAVLIGKPTPVIFDPRDKIYTDNGVTFGSLTHLDSIGLIQFDAIANFEKGGLSDRGYIEYGNTKVFIELPRAAANKMQLGNVMLSRVGRELLPLCETRNILGFPDYLKTKWRGFGIKIGDDQGRFEELPLKQKPASDASETTLAISHTQISEMIESAPPLQRHAIEDSFKGVWVRWQGKLYDAVSYDKKNPNVLIKHFSHREVILHCKASLDACEPLLALAEGADVYVSGRIYEISPLSVILENCTFEVVNTK